MGLDCGSGSLERLKDLRSILKKEEGFQHSKETICEMVGLASENIPYEIIAILNASSQINDDFSDIFLGYQCLSIDEISDIYNRLNDDESFFGYYGVDANFNIKDDYYIEMEDSLVGECEDDCEIGNLRSFIPLFQFQGDYIAINLDKSSDFRGLVIIVNGHIGNMLAPSLKDHIDDLTDGLTSGIYIESEAEVVFPTSWYLRKKVSSGEAKMDEYGEVNVE